MKTRAHRRPSRTALFTLEINIPHLVTHPTVSFMLMGFLTLSGLLVTLSGRIEILFPSPLLATSTKKPQQACRVWYYTIGKC